MGFQWVLAREHPSPWPRSVWLNTLVWVRPRWMADITARSEFLLPSFPSWWLLLTQWRCLFLFLSFWLWFSCTLPYCSSTFFLPISFTLYLSLSNHGKGPTVCSHKPMQKLLVTSGVIAITKKCLCTHTRAHKCNPQHKTQKTVG